MLTFTKKLLGNKHSLSLSGNFVAAGFGFVSLGLIARMLDKGSVGNWSIFLTAYTFMEMLRNGLVITSLVRFLSGRPKHEAIKFNGAGWLISLIFTLAFVLVDLLLWYFLRGIQDRGWLLFLQWAPVALIVSLPINYTIGRLQADLQFGKILKLRLINQIFNFSFLLILFLSHRSTILWVIYSFLISFTLADIYAFASGWCQIADIRRTDRKSVRDLLNFGKYSMGTSIGSNLLKSSDIFIIQAMMGPGFTAIYSIPQKLLDIIEIPLRSLVATALPTMAGQFNQNKPDQVSATMQKYAGVITLLLFPLILFCFLFSHFVVTLLGGRNFADSSLTLKILMVYSIFLPIDRFLGVTLDIINKPQLNFLKIVIMLSINVAGDILAIHYFHSVNAVAAGSSLTFLAGVIAGYFLLKKHLDFNLGSFIQSTRVNAIKFIKTRKF